MTNRRSYQILFGLAAQFFVTHFIIGILALFLSTSNMFPADTRDWQPIFIVAGVVGTAGVVLTINVVWSIQLVDSGLYRLINQLPMPILRWYGHGVLARMVEQVQEIGERERPFAEMHEQTLSQVQQTAAQEERNRLARDLHDSIKQQLFSISMSSAAVEARWENDPEGAKASLADVRHSTQAALTEMNALLQQLAPAPLAQVGFVAALKEQCQALAYRSGAEVDMQVGVLPDDGRLPPNTQETLFRIAQEALSNIARHARAHEVQVELAADETKLHLSIRDDGQGFDREAVQGRGLENITERVNLLNGHWQLTTKPNKGTQIQVSVPLRQTKQEQELMETDNTFNQIAGMIFAGVLAVMAVMAYPLYSVWPSQVWADWPSGSSFLGGVCVVVASALTVGIGYLVGRTAGHERHQAIGWGAFAGGATGFLLVSGLAGATASISGHAAIFEHGLQLATEEAYGQWLLAESTLGIIWQVHTWLWVTVLIGTILGGIGGYFAPLRLKPLRWDKLEIVGTAIAFAFLLTAMMSLTMSVAVHGLLEYSLLDNAIRYELTYTRPVWGVSFWTILTPAILYVLGNMLLIWLGTMAKQQDNSWYPTFDRYMCMAINLTLPLLLFLIVEDQTLTVYPYIIGVTIICTIFYSMYWFQLNHFWDELDADRPQAIRNAHVGILLSGLGAFGFALWSAMNTALVLSVVCLVFFVFVIAPRYKKRPLQNPDQAIPRATDSILGSVLAFTLGVMSIMPHALGLVLLTVRAIPVITAGTDDGLMPFAEQIPNLFQIQLFAFGATVFVATCGTMIMVLITRLSVNYKARKTA